MTAILEPRLRPETSRRLAQRPRRRPERHAVRIVRPRPRRSSPAIIVAAVDTESSAPVGVRLRVDFILPLLVFLVSLLTNLGAIAETPFHPDESRWINRAHFIGDLADPFGPTWDDYYTTRGQPPLGSYLMGLGLLLQGRDLDTNLIWDFSYDAEWNESFGAMASDADLLAGRRTNAVVSALVVVAVYFLGRRLTTRIGGFVGALFLALHPLSIYLAAQALSDQLLALCLALAFIAAHRFGARPSWPGAITLGAMLGLGGATKLSPLLLSVPLAIVGMVWLAFAIKRRRLKLDRSLTQSPQLMLVAQPLIAFATFVFVSPYLWPNPIQRTYHLFEFRRVEMLGQGRNWPDVAVGNPLDALDRVGRRLDEINSTSSRLQDIFQRQVGIAWNPVSIDLLLVVIGGLLLIRLIFRDGLVSATGLTSLLIGAEAAAVIVGMGSDFYRYYMPVVLVAAILVGVTAGELLRPPRGRWLVRQISKVPGADLVAGGQSGSAFATTIPGRHRDTDRSSGVQSPR